MRTKLLTNLTLLVLLIGFAALLLKMMTNRFEEGSVYPEYSSLRSDPLGSRALYESFTSLPDRHVERNYQEWQTLLERPPGTLLLLGQRRLLPLLLHVENRPLRALVERGWRVVVSVHSGSSRLGDLEGMDFNAQRWLGLLGPLELRRRGSQIENQQDFHLFQADRVWNEARLPAQIESHTALVFHNVPDGWRSVYQIEEAPMVIETSIGKGSLVLLSDSFSLSNEGLWRSPQAGFLLWLMGPHKAIYFDEVVHGSRVDTDIPNVMAQLRLQGFVVGFVIVVLLVLWRWMRPLVAPQTSAATLQAQGHDTASGLVQLTMRAVPVKELLQTCYREWCAHMPMLDRRDKAAQEEVTAMVEHSKPQQAVETYQKIHERLYARRKRW